MGYDVTKMAVGTINSLTASIENGGIPLVTETTASLQATGKAILAYQARTNQFCTALVNRIIETVLNKKAYENHFKFFKKGERAFGETVEEVYFGLCDVHGYDPAQAASRIFGINKPDVSSAFHSMNLAVTYPLTINETQLQRAFTSFEAWDRFVQECIATIFESVEYDEEQVFKWTLSKILLTGRVHCVTIDAPSATTSNAITIAIKKISNDMEFKKNKYTIAKVLNFAKKEDQVLLESGETNAVLDVETLAKAFNMDRAQFMGRTVLFDNLDEIDEARIAKLLSLDSGYQAFTDGEKAALGKVRAVLVSKDFFMIWDVYRKMGDIYNPDGMYRNYRYNVGQTWSVSPFENCVLFSDASNAVSAVTVTGLSAISMAGTYDYAATVTRSGFATDEVTWSVSGTPTSTKVSIDQFGRLTVGSGYTTGSYTITATSKFDGTTAGTKTVTLS